MDVGVIASGLAFNGFDKETNEPKFDRVQSAILWKLEFSSSFKELIASWNMSVPKWLRNYVFLRIASKDKKKGGFLKAAIITFLVSAVWHGLLKMALFVAKNSLFWSEKCTVELDYKQ